MVNMGGGAGKVSLEAVKVFRNAYEIIKRLDMMAEEFATFDPQVDVRWIIFNRVACRQHLDTPRKALCEGTPWPPPCMLTSAVVHSLPGTGPAPVWERGSIISNKINIIFNMYIQNIINVIFELNSNIYQSRRG